MCIRDSNSDDVAVAEAIARAIRHTSALRRRAAVAHQHPDRAAAQYGRAYHAANRHRAAADLHPPAPAAVAGGRASPLAAPSAACQPNVDR